MKVIHLENQDPQNMQANMQATPSKSPSRVELGFKHPRSADLVQGELRGRVRSARLAWTDPESGERLTVDLQGSDGFLLGLERQGFENLGAAPLLDKPRNIMDTLRRAWSGRVQFARARAGERRRA